MPHPSRFFLSDNSNGLQPRGLTLAVFLVIMLIFAATNKASAASATWSGTTDGNWVTGTNWSTTPVPGAGNTATFNGAGNGNTLITIDSGRNVGSITFDTGSAAAYTIGSAGVGLGNTLTLTSGGAITVNSSVTQTQTFNAPVAIGSAGGSTYSISMNVAGALKFQGPITSVGTSGTTTLTIAAAAGTTTISGDITDSGTGTSTALSQSGSGTLILSGHNTYSGTTLLNGFGAVRADDGVGFSPNSNIVEASANIQTSTNFLRSIGTGAGQISFSQGATVDFTAVGGNIVVALGGTSNPTQLTMGAGNNFNVSNFLLNDGYGGGPTGTVDFRNPINLNGASANFGGRGNNGTTTLVTMSGVISGTGAVNFIYNGQTALTGANTFDAPFTLGSHATLYVSSIGHIGSTSSNLGAPTTAANGKITLGNSSGGGNIVYSGSGETTDRNFLLACNNVGINHSGTGLLKFTGDFTMISVYHQVLPFTLSGSTAGAGEISGAIADDPGHLSPLELDKNGTGTWTVSGTNTYTAPTKIFAGTLKFGKQVSLYNNGAAATWNSTNIQVTSGATLGLNVGGTGEFTTSDVSTLAALLPSGAFIGLDGSNGSGGSYSYNSVLSAPSGVGLDVLGNLTLTQSNTYTGPTKVSSGRLTIGANAPSGSAGALGNASGAVTLGSANAEGAAAILTNGAYTVARNITEASSAANSSLSIGGSQTSGTSTYTGNITLTKNTTLTSASGGEVDFTTGVISGAFSTVIDGGGTVKLTGTNTFGGSGKSVTVQNGTNLNVTANVNLGDSNNSLVLDNGRLQFTSAFDPSTRTITFGSGGATIDTNGNAVTFANSVGNGGSGGLTKTGANSLTLSASNSYSGPTTVSLGTLVIGHTGAIGSGNVAIASGATLSSSVSSYSFAGNVVNNGTINSNGHNISFASGKTLSGNSTLSGGGTYTVLGTLSPGNSPGTETIGASTTLTLDSGATTIWQLNSTTSSVAGTNYDTFVLDPTAVVNLSGALQIALDGISFSADPYWEINHSYTLFSGGGTVNGNFTSITGDYTYTNVDGTGTFSRSGNVINYTFVAVPEPRTWALAALGCLALLLRIRFRRRTLRLA